MKKKIYTFLEDPGAANYVINLRQKLRYKGINLFLHIGGRAVSYLHDRNIKIDYVGKNTEHIKRMLLECGLVLVGTSENKDSQAFQIIDSAKELNLRTVGIVDAPTSVKSRFKGRTDNPLYYCPDIILCSHIETKQAYLKLGINKDDLHLVRHPLYDHVLDYKEVLKAGDFVKQRLELFGQEVANRKIIVFLSEISDGLNSEDFKKNKDYTLSADAALSRRTEVVLDAILTEIHPYLEDVYFVIRLHPKDSKSTYRNFEHKVNLFHSAGSPLPIIYHADLIIGMTSNLLSEAALLDKKVISVVPKKAETAWLPSAVDPPISQVWTRQDLRKLLDEYFMSNSNVKHSRVDLNWPELASVLSAEINKEIN